MGFNPFDNFGLFSNKDEGGVKSVADFVLVVAGEFSGKKGSDILRLDGVDGGSGNVVINGFKCGLRGENDVGRVFGLHNAPVIGDL